MKHQHVARFFLRKPLVLICLLRWIPAVLLQRTVINKLLVCVCCLLWFFIITKAFPVTYNVDPQFVSEASFVTRLAYALISVQAARPKFYFAWTLGKQKGTETWDVWLAERRACCERLTDISHHAMLAEKHLFQNIKTNWQTTGFL